MLTTLGRVGSPLLRYRTGDLVKLQSPISKGNNDPQACVCGRHEVALVGGILGRTDDMLVVRGVNVYPSAVEEIVRGCAGVAEYQANVILKNSLSQLSLLVEPRTDCVDPSRLVRTLEKAFETAFSLRVPISLAPAGSLPRWEMKAHRWQIQR